MNAIHQRTRISSERFRKMVEAGVLTGEDRIELIEGELLDMAPIGSLHQALTARLTRLFNRLLRDEEAIVSPAGSLNLGAYSTPQPDLMILKYRPDFYASQLPTAADVLLLIEISDSTLRFDLETKAPLYARYAIAEYWIIDVSGQRLLSFRAPHYKLEAKEPISPQAFPDVRITLRDLFGDR